eukprot:6479596-Amphidinium_carterae.2
MRDMKVDHHANGQKVLLHLNVLWQFETPRSSAQAPEHMQPVPVQSVLNQTLNQNRPKTFGIA